MQMMLCIYSLVMVAFMMAMSAVVAVTMAPVPVSPFSHLKGGGCTSRCHRHES